jgi:hypothetical protein
MYCIAVTVNTHRIDSRSNHVELNINVEISLSKVNRTHDPSSCVEERERARTCQGL